MEQELITLQASVQLTSGPADLSLFAKWQANTYLISYNGNGATGGSAPDGGTYVTGGSTYTIAANRSGADGFSKTGFTFAGWNTAANGGGTDKLENATGFTTATDVVFYAKWSATSYTVSYASGDNAVSPPITINQCLRI